MTLNILIGLLIATAMEIIALPIFIVIKKYFEGKAGENEAAKSDKLSVFKGALERTVIYFALINGVPTIVVMFGAIKLGTRLADNSKTKISNDYFLIGNFISVLLSIMAFAVYNIITSER